MSKKFHIVLTSWAGWTYTPKLFTPDNQTAMDYAENLSNDEDDPKHAVVITVDAEYFEKEMTDA